MGFNWTGLIYLNKSGVRLGFFGLMILSLSEIALAQSTPQPSVEDSMGEYDQDSSSQAADNEDGKPRLVLIKSLPQKGVDFALSVSKVNGFVILPSIDLHFLFRINNHLVDYEEGSNIKSRLAAVFKFFQKTHQADLVIYAPDESQETMIAFEQRGRTIISPRPKLSTNLSAWLRVYLGYDGIVSSVSGDKVYVNVIDPRILQQNRQALIHRNSAKQAVTKPITTAQAVAVIEYKKMMQNMAEFELVLGNLSRVNPGDKIKFEAYDTN